MAAGRKDFEERKENRINRLEEKAVRAKKETDQHYQKSADAVKGIEPILAGHHSERKHRAAIKKTNPAMDKPAASEGKPSYYQEKAETAKKNNSISGDDPEAVSLYKAKLKKLETIQAQMKAMNAYWRKNKTMKGYAGLPDKEAKKIDEKINTSFSCVLKSGSYEYWLLRKNNAEIRRIKQKLESLEKPDSMAEEATTFKNGEMRVNAETNRVQFIFGNKPSDEARPILKHNGFKRSPSEGARQRQRTQNAISTAKNLMAGESFIANDPKGELYQKTFPLLNDREYKIVVINLREPLRSSTWNPLQIPYTQYRNGQKDKATEFVMDMANCITHDGNNVEPYWENSGAGLLAGLIMLLFEYADEKEIHFKSFVNFSITCVQLLSLL